MKYTKGPWEVTGKKKLYIEPINMRLNYTALWVDCQTCNKRKSTDITEGSQIYNPRKIKEAQANARLIAAAPDLLEALNLLCKTVRPHVMSLKIKKGFSEHLALVQADKAIEKATK